MKKMISRRHRVKAQFCSWPRWLFQPRMRAAATAEAEIRAVMKAQVAAWNRGDIDGFMEGYARSDATEFVSGDKLTRGWQTVRDRYQKKYESREKMGTLAFPTQDHAARTRRRGRRRPLETRPEKRPAAWHFHPALPPHSRRLANRP